MRYDLCRQIAFATFAAGTALVAISPRAQAQDDGEIVRSLQQPVAEAPVSGFRLAPSSSLIGRYGLDAKAVLAVLAPHLVGASLRPKGPTTGAGGDVVHEEFELWFGPWKLDDAYLSLHHHKNRLVFLRAKLPDYRLPSEPPADEDFLALPSLGFDPPADGSKEAAVKVLAASSGFAAPAWELRQFDRSRGQTVERVIDAQTGAVLRVTESAFDAQIYEKNPRDSVLTTVDLPDLGKSAVLDGTHFRVFAPTETDARANAPDLKFDFRPDDPTEAPFFDQVQAYYAATKAYSFFKDRFGYELGAARLTVRINGLVAGRAENAAYLPPPEGPEIQVGRGGEHLMGLPRDTDVIVHEFGHHVIFAHVTTSSGESGIFHEGTADYFAYVVASRTFLT